ncbi:hypothetical protein D3C72_1160540 [compost metagenome]
MRRLGRQFDALQQSRQGKGRQHQGDDDHARRQEDGQVARRHGRAVAQHERQGQNTSQGDGAPHPRQRHDSHQPQADLGRRVLPALAEQGELQRRPNPDEAQGRQRGDNGEDIDRQPPDLLVLGRLDDLGRTGHDRRHLFAQDDEDQAVGDELHRVPHHGATDARRRHGRALTLGEAHGHAGCDGRQNTRGVYDFGGQIGGEGNQQADQDLTANVLAPAAADPALQQADGQGHDHADGDPGHSQPGEGPDRAGQGEGAGRRGDDGDPHAGQARRVVQQRLAFEDMHQPLGDRRPRGDG